MRKFGSTPRFQFGQLTEKGKQNEEFLTFRRSFVFSFVFLVIVAAAFTAGYFVRDWQGGGTLRYSLVNQAYGILTDHGLKTMPEHKELEYGMIRGLLQAYDDPYTTFVEPTEHELETYNLQGSYGGIGAGLGRDDEGYWVVFPFPDGPANTAGLEDGDRLLAVDGLEISPDTGQNALLSAIRGPVGKKVRILAARPPEYETVEVQVARAEFPIPSVSWYQDPGEPRVGVIKINLIAASTVDEIQKGFLDLVDQGAVYFVLDLRDNPGGLLTAGIDVARLFLKDGVVLEQQYRGQNVETFRVDRPGALADIPLVVLINKGSASAAEIIAGAIQARGRADLIGTPSYGKDSIQLVFDLADKSSLHVTSARWWIPGLETPLGGAGLQPDLFVEPGAESSGPDPMLIAARQALLAPAGKKP
jgi:carboxyl-terminal processing protease